jgi:hypothetical protein
MFRSLRGSTAAKSAPPPAVHTPPAFTGRRSNGLPPPPVRRVSPAAPVTEPEPTEEEEAGEWAEALYDYTSEVGPSSSFYLFLHLERVTGCADSLRSLQEAGDLHLQAGERVLVTEKTSSDWCARPRLSAPDLGMLIIVI